MKEYIKPEISIFDIDTANTLMAASEVTLDPSGTNEEDRGKTSSSFDLWDDDEE